MSVTIRLRRMGKKKQPHYRIVAADSRSPRDGRFVENLGYYQPISDPARLSVDLARVDYWVGQGASVSSTVRSLVSRARAGGDDTVALVGADRGSDTEAEAQVAAGNGAAAEAPATAGDGAEATAETQTEADAAAETPEAEAEAGDAAAADTREAEAGDDATPDTPEAEAADATTAATGDAAEADAAPESADADDTAPESGAA